jgi:Calpain family cysteine protease
MKHGILDDPSVGDPLSLTAPPAAPMAEALYENGIAVTDINQGGINDCYLMSSMIELVRKGPQFISNMIHQNADGTETVRLYEDSSGSLAAWNSTSFKPVYETVNNASFDPIGVNALATQDVTAAGVKEIWPQVIEQAYAQLNGGIANIDAGGSPVVAMETLTGHAASTVSTTFNYATLVRLINQNDTMTFDTLPFGALSNGLIANHSYAYGGANVAGPNGSQTTINLLNPWGNTQPTPVPISMISQEFGSVDLGHAS